MGEGIWTLSGGFGNRKTLEKIFSSLKKKEGRISISTQIEKCDCSFVD